MLGRFKRTLRGGCMIKEEERANIRCKCRKLWGVRLFQQNKVCKRCKTQVKARGVNNE